MSRIERSNEKFQRAGTKTDLHEARAEHREAISWKCASCNKMIEDQEDEAIYCRSCAVYWRDVDNGLFEE